MGTNNYAREGLTQIIYCTTLEQAKEYAKKYLELTPAATNESLSDAAKKYIEEAGSDYNRMYGHHFRSFKTGAEWQKEKDDAIINKLLGALKELNNYWESGNFSRDHELWNRIKNAIQKADQKVNGMD